MTKFDYGLDFETTNFRKHPERYRIGRGEQGVLLVQPYKDELLPLWRFATPELAQRSSQRLLSRFRHYGRQGDFVGMDMARKYLQMGVTRARRYANHRSGKKYAGAVPLDKKGQSGAHGRAVLPREPDAEKAASAAIFTAALAIARADKRYLQLKQQHLERVGN